MVVKGTRNWRLFNWDVQKSALLKEQAVQLSTLDFAENFGSAAVAVLRRARKRSLVMGFLE